MAEKRTESEFQELVLKQFGEIHSEIKEIKTDIRGMHSELTDIKETLEPLARAVDSDAETIVEHTNRLTRVEKHIGIII